MFGNGMGFTQTFDVVAKDLSGKRVAKILENPAHAWAHQSQTFGQSSKGNFYFEGPALYSYGSHFLVGFRVMPQGDRHSGYVLLNKETHGVTTSRHQQYARSATRQLQQLMIPELTELRDTLKSCPPDLSEQDRQRIAAHVKKYFDQYQLDNAAAFLAYAGFADPMKMALRYQALAEKAKQEAAKREAKRVLADAISVAKHALDYAGKRKPEMDTALAGYIREFREDGYCVTLERNLDKATRAHKALPTKTHKRLKAAAWSMVKALRAAKAEGLEQRAIAERASLTLQYAKEFRRYAERYANHGIDLDGSARHCGLGQYDFQQWQGAIGMIERARPAGNVKLRESLERTGREIEAHLETFRQHYEKRAAAERAKQFAKAKEAREAWLAGGPRWYGTAADGTALLRVKGDMLETSQGANVPLEHAIKAFKLIRLCRERGTGWKRNGHSLRVGHYQVDEIQPNGDFQAGCHSIAWSEVERVALALGIFETVAAADTSENTHV